MVTKEYVINFRLKDDFFEYEQHEASKNDAEKAIEEIKNEYDDRLAYLMLTEITDTVLIDRED